MANQTIAADAHVRKHLEQINRHLEVVHAGILVSAHALQLQDCEIDCDVARVLVHCVSERLSVQMERIGEILGQMEADDFDLTEPPAGFVGLRWVAAPVVARSRERSAARTY